MLIDPQVVYQIPTTPITTQILQWINGLTLPGLIITAIAASRWYTKKEDEAKAVVADALAKLESIRTNDLHHIQTSLDSLNTSLEKHHDLEEENQRDLIAAMNSSKDAIVNAIISTHRA